MTQLDDETRHNLEILKALNQAIENGPWNYSGFFRAIGNKLIDVRNRFRDELHLGTVEETGMPASIANRIAMRSGLIEVFILLYNADGATLGKWEHIIQNLKHHAINRPVYSEESQAKAALRSAMNKQNEAYIAAYIRAEDIIKLPPEKQPRDRWGNELLLLNDGVVKLNNVTRFIHISGNYEVENGKLIRVGTADFL